MQDKVILSELSEARGQFSRLIKGAGAAFVITGRQGETSTWLSDTAIMATYVQLLAEDQGLKSCWVHVENREADDGSDTETNVKNILQIPKKYGVHCIIAVGYGDEDKEGYKEEDLDFSRVHWEEF